MGKWDLALNLGYVMLNFRNNYSVQPPNLFFLSWQLITGINLILSRQKWPEAERI